MLKINKNFLYTLGVWLISIVLVIYLVYTGVNHYFYGDDFILGIYTPNEGIFDCLFKDAGKIHGGGYFALFLTKLFCTGIPMLFNQHPFAFMNRGQTFFQSLVLIWMFVTYVNFFQFSKKFKSIYFVYYLFICVFFLYTLDVTGGRYIFGSNNNFWRYPFTFVFFNIFFLNFYNMITKKNIKISKFHYLSFLFSGIVCFTNHELIIYISAFLMLITGIYNLIIKLFVKKHSGLLFNLNLKNYIIPLILNFTAMTLFVTSEGYKIVTNQRMFHELRAVKEILGDFSSLYFKLIFLDYWVYWLVFAILFGVVIGIAKKKKEYNKVILPVFLIIGTLTVLYSLVLCPPNFMRRELWLNHGGIITVYRMISAVPLFIFADYIIKNSGKYRRKLLNFVFVLLLVLSVLFICFSHYGIKNYKDIRINNANKTLYIGEKMLRFYYLKNKTPYLYMYDFSIKNRVHDGLYKYRPKDLRFHHNIMPKASGGYGFMPEKSQGDYILCNNMNPYVLYFYSQIYNESIEKIKELGVCYSYDAFERFFNEGGVITKEELDELSFQKLKDDNFVINGENKTNVDLKVLKELMPVPESPIYK